MNKSFIDRIFPHSSGSALPQHEQAEPLVRPLPRSPKTPPYISMNDDAPRTVTGHVRQSSPLPVGSEASLSPKVKDSSLRSTPLSTSVLHHDDPFLPIERASRALEASIQLLLDAQSRALSGRTSGVDQEDATSAGSLTPTQSAMTPRSASGLRTIPIRQPVRKPITLRGARKGLSKKMHEFAELREQELQILEAESQSRMQALGRLEHLEAKREKCTAEIEVIRQADTSTTATNLRSEAKNVKSEIDELEHRLLELRVRHRHLLDQADQLESTLESKISSFQGTIAMIDKETRQFLRQPPVPHALAGGSIDGQPGMYAFKPERRTLVMAREQWSSEQEILANRRIEVEDEVNALHEGERIWSETVQRITSFEQELRQHTANFATRPADDPQNSMDTVLQKLESMIENLESDVATAETKGWSLLICAIGAELEAFHQAHELLKQTQQMASDQSSRTIPTQGALLEQESNQANLIGDVLSPVESVESNQSLNDTLNEFAHRPNHPTKNVDHRSNKYESEDDEPPADFFVSQ